MKPDSVSPFKQAGHSEGGVESARGNAKARKGQGGGAVGGASDFAKLLGHSTKQLADDRDLPLAAAGDHGPDRQAPHDQPADDTARSLAAAPGRDRQVSDGISRRARPAASPVPGRVGETPPARSAEQVEVSPAIAGRPQQDAAAVFEQRPVAGPHAMVDVGAAKDPRPAAPSRPATQATPAVDSRPAVASPQAQAARPMVDSRPVVELHPGVQAHAARAERPATEPARGPRPPLADGAAVARSPEPTTTAVKPSAGPGRPIHPEASPPREATPRTAETASPTGQIASPASMRSAAQAGAQPAPTAPATRATTPTSAATPAVPGPAAPAKTVATAVAATAPAQPQPATGQVPSQPVQGQAPVASAARAVETPTRPAGQAVPPSVNAESPRTAPQAQAAPDRRPAAVGIERRAPQAPVAPASGEAAPAERTPARNGEQAPSASVTPRTPQRPIAAPMIAAEPKSQALADGPVPADVPAPGVASEHDSGARGPAIARGERRPIRPSRSELQPVAPEESRAGQAPLDAHGHRPAPQRPAQSSAGGQPEPADAQQEIRRAVEAQPGVLPLELTARPKLTRPRELTGESDPSAEDRKPVRMAVEKDLPNLLLMQLSAPPPVLPPELVNARLQVLARDGRRALESAAISAGADALQAPGSDAGKPGKNERELPWQGPALTLPLDATLPASLNATAPVVEGPAAPPLPPGAAPLLDQAALDPGLNVSVMSKAAHMTITNDDGRALELHLRMSPEGADIRASGNLAPMVQARVAELGMALASQGLTLGSFEMGRDGQGRSSRDGEEDRDSARDDGSGGRRAVRANTPTGSGSVTNVAGRIHVKV